MRSSNRQEENHTSIQLQLSKFQPTGDLQPELEPKGLERGRVWKLTPKHSHSLSSQLCLGACACGRLDAAVTECQLRRTCSAFDGPALHRARCPILLLPALWPWSPTTHCDGFVHVAAYLAHGRLLTWSTSKRWPTSSWRARALLGVGPAPSDTHTIASSTFPRLTFLLCAPCHVVTCHIS